MRKVLNERRARARFGAKLSLAAGTFVATYSTAYGCALGLDHAKIDARVPDADISSSLDATYPDAASSTVLEASASDADASPPACAINSDCVSASTCEVGSCDAGECTFVLCPTASCQGSSCSATTSSCSAPVAYGFHASAIDIVAGSVGCGGNASVCMAAAYPFVFVGTSNGVVAYAVTDPSNPTPPAVAITGLPFLPSFLTSIGSRVYFVGSPQGAGPAYRLAVATLDVPSDPLVTSLQATTVFDQVSVSGLSNAWAAADGSLYLFDDDPSETLPVAKLSAPLVDNQSIGFFPAPGVPVGAAPVVPSGSRLVVARWDGSSVPFQTYFSFETGAATSNAQSSGEQSTLAAIGATTPQSTYVQGKDGSVVWNTGTSVVDDAGENAYGSVRVAWLVASGAATQLAPSQFVDVEVYSPPVPYGSPLVGPVAWLDATTAIVLASAAENTAQTSVQVAVGTPSPSLVSNRRYVLPQSVAEVGVAASGGYGYVLAAGGSIPNASCTLHVFAPGCSTSP